MPRRYLPPLLMLLPVIFICGKLLLTPAHPDYDLKSFSERGWPWVFEQSYDWPSSGNAFWTWLLLADLTVLSAAVLVAGLIVAWQWKRSRSLLRFSLRGMFMLVAIIAVLCGWWNSHAQQHSREKKYTDTPSDSKHSSDRFKFCGPAWVQRLAPEQIEEAFWHLVKVQIEVLPSENARYGEIPSYVVSELPYFVNLRELSFVDQEIGDDDLILRLSERDRKAIEHVGEIYLSGVDTDDETIQTLAMLPHLDHLWISGGPISDRGIAALANCQRLKSLSLNECRNITEQCIDSLIAIPHLTSLFIHHCLIVNEKNIQRFSEFPKLEHLDLGLLPLEPSPQALKTLHDRIPRIWVGGKLWTGDKWYDPGPPPTLPYPPLPTSTSEF